MATRRKSSGFTTSENEDEKVSVEEFLEKNASEMFETISQAEERAAEKTKETGAPPQTILPEITPTDFISPEPVKEAPTPPSQPRATSPANQPKPAPKRHPRNIPKFSRFK